MVNPVREYGLLLQLVLRKRRPLSTTLTDRPKLYRLDKLKTLFIKGSDRQSEVVELSMQYCAQIL